MSNVTTYKFNGQLTAVSPLTVTRMGENFMSHNGSNKMQRLPRMGAKKEETPAFFPGASLRGAIRRATWHVVRKAVIARTGDSKPFDLDTHYMMVQGVDVTNETIREKIAGTITKESDLRKANPFLSLFGRWRLASHVGIGNAIPPEDSIFIERGVRTNDYIRSPDEIEFLSEDDVNRLTTMLSEDGDVSEIKKGIDDEIKSLMKQKKASQDEEETKQLNEKIQALKTKIKETKQNKEGAEESIQRPLEGYEAIKSGTIMDNKLILQNGNVLELGLFLAGLREFARNPYVGGHRGHGAGEMSARWTVTTWPENENNPITLGTVRFDETGFFIENESDLSVLTDALNHWEKTVADKNCEIDFHRFLV